MGLFSPVIRSYLQAVQNQVHGRLLDVGCGDKPYADVFTNVTEHIGVDLPPETGVEGRAESRFSSIDVFGSATDLPFGPASFDAVLCTQVLAHLMDPEGFFSEASRVLKDDGILLVTFPMISPLYEVPHEYFRYTEFSFSELCQRHGLDVVEVQKMGGGWLAVGFLIRGLLYSDAAKCKTGVIAKLLHFLGACIYGVLSRLDKLDKHPECPLNYLGVARKRSA